jgi:hypothetical protein
VREEEARRVSPHAGDPDAVVVTDAALLVESGIHLRFDRLVVVHCEPEQQLARLMARDGVDEESARARIAAQMPVEEKRRFAHFGVDATRTPGDTDRAADQLASELRRLARAPRRPLDVPLPRRLGALVAGPARGPRGLDPPRLLADIAAAGGLEMERAARLLLPPPSQPWYRAALPEAPDKGPETLAGPLVVWAAGRGGDDEFLAAAAFSLARLTHVDDAEVAGAILFALVLGGVLAVEPLAPGLLARVGAWARLAQRWSGAEPPRRIAEAVQAAVRDGGTAGGLAGWLHGAATGMPVGKAPEEIVRALEELERQDRA